MGNPIVIADYDPTWPASFAELKRALADGLGDVAIAIEHVGSTSVPGLSAKPILDINVVVAAHPDSSPLPEAIARLARLGYEHQGDLGISGRHAFRDPGGDAPRDGTGRAWPVHYLYVSAADNPELARQLAFRDFLRANPESAATYGALKRELAVRFASDRDGYSRAKTGFVEEILRLAAA